MNYFELFDIPASLTIDQVSLTKKYFDLQRLYHPDFYSNAGEERREEMLQKSSLVNKAYKVFQLPEETIKYVLELKGQMGDDEKYDLSPAFLTEMMELNEGLLNVDDPGFEETEVKIHQFEKSLYEHVRMIIEGYDEGVTTDEQMLMVKDYYYKKKYLGRILERMAGMLNIAG